MDALVVMAKEPRAKEVKTRLTPPLDPEKASRLYCSFLLDKIEQIRGIDAACHFIAYTPDEAEDFFRRIVIGGFKLIVQTGADLGERLDNISNSLFDLGFEKVVILDSDTPNLPTGYILEGLKRLDNADVVLGPCEDGGYYLIGMRTSTPEQIFKDIPWSTSRVTEITIKKALNAGLTVSLLNTWYDVDKFEDLLRLKRDLSTAGKNRSEGVFCDHTYSAISEIEIEHRKS